MTGNSIKLGVSGHFRLIWKQRRSFSYLTENADKTVNAYDVLQILDHRG